jgi:hypothetical protein
MVKQATVLVSDDFMLSLQGKFTIIGVYTSDIVIPSDEQQVAQLVFTFIVELGVEDLPAALTLEVTLPGDSLRQMIFPLAPPQIKPPDRKQLILRLPFLISQPILRPGRINARVAYPGGEILAAAPWIAKSATVSQSGTAG